MLLKWIYVFLLTYYIMLKDFSENNLEVIVTEVDIFQWRNNIVRGDFLLANKIKLVFSDVIVPKWPCCLLPSQLLRGVACFSSFICRFGWFSNMKSVFFPLIFRYLIWNINFTITKKRQLPRGSKLGEGWVLTLSTCATNLVTCTNKVFKRTWFPFCFLNGVHLLLCGICIRKLHNTCDENGRSNWKSWCFWPHAWNSYKERLDSYFLVNDIEDEKKVPALRSLVGTRTYSLLRDLTAPKQLAEKTYGTSKRFLNNTTH